MSQELITAVQKMFNTLLQEASKELIEKTIEKTMKKLEDDLHEMVGRVAGQCASNLRMDTLDQEIILRINISDLDLKAKGWK